MSVYAGVVYVKETRRERERENCVIVLYGTIVKERERAGIPLRIGERERVGERLLGVMRERKKRERVCV